MIERYIWTALGMQEPPPDYVGPCYVPREHYLAERNIRLALDRRMGEIADSKTVKTANLLTAAVELVGHIRYNKLLTPEQQRLVAAVDEMRNPCL